MRVHPAAEIFPTLAGPDLAALAADIKTHGLREPIVLLDGQVLDGRNRLAACKLAHVEPRTKEIRCNDPLAFVLSANLHRRHLDESQRAMVGARIKVLFEAEAKARMQAGVGQGGATGGRGRKNPTANLRQGFAAGGAAPAPKAARSASGHAAAAVNVSPRSVEAAAKVLAAAPAVAAAVDAGQLAVSAAALLVSRPAAEQTAALSKIVAGKISGRQVSTEVRRAERAERLSAQLAQQPARATIVAADALAWLGSVADGSVDLLLTDPPYMTDVPDICAFAASWLPVALAKLKPSGQAYFCTGSYPEELRTYLECLASIRFHGATALKASDLLVWTYRNTLGPSPQSAYKRNWQAIFYVRGPKAPPLECPSMVEQFSVQDIAAPDGRIGNRFHPWQKPDELAERFVRHASKPGDVVIDPFAGTGTFLLAAAKLGRVAIGCDLDPSIAISRGCLAP